MNTIKTLLVSFIMAIAAHAETFPSIPFGNNADLTSFRGFANRSQIPPVSPDSIRVFYMGQGVVAKVVEISLKTGLCKVWPGHFDESKYKEFTIGFMQLAAVNSALDDSALESIPTDVGVSFDGFCQLLEINKKEYYWRMHRNSTAGYFRAVCSVVYLAGKASEK